MDHHLHTENALPLCRKWYETCCREHVCKPEPNSSLPTRLVSVVDAVPHLVLASELEEATPYATLSHCWGGLKFITLRQSLLQSFRKAIPRERLTKTFQDAIYITRQLGLSYIWIDSLCIIQDSARDCEVESRRMWEVYGGTAINIAAASAKDGHGGCFAHPAWVQTTMTDGVGHESPVLVECIPTHEENGLLPEGLPLLTRGWVVQERWLPSRAIYFTHRQVFWECDGLRASAELPSGGGPQSQCEVLDEFLLHGNAGAACMVMPENMREVQPFRFRREPLTLTVWSEIVRCYSQCRLTKASDKLAAIMGLAMVVQTSLGCRYVAGMWEQDVVDQLPWYLAPVEALGSRDEVRAMGPSWSWVSVDGCVVRRDRYLSYEPRTRRVEVEKLEVDYASDNTFGAVTRAELSLRCRALYYGKLGEFEYLQEHIGSCFFGNDEMPGRLSIDVWWDSTGDSFGIEEQAWYLLPTHYIPKSGLWGLVVQPCDRGQGFYERAGCFWHYNGGTTSDETDRLLAGADCVAPGLRSHFTLVNDRREADAAYVITLV